jgi:hypothetical protein
LTYVHRHQHTRGSHQPEERAVVPRGHAVVEPLAVVVEALDALVARAAVLRRRLDRHLAQRAEKRLVLYLHARPETKELKKRDGQEEVGRKSTIGFPRPFSRGALGHPGGGALKAAWIRCWLKSLRGRGGRNGCDL